MCLMNMKRWKPHSTIDVRELVPPLSLLKVENGLAELTPGQIVEILCADEETKSDMMHIIRNSKHACIAAENVNDYFKLLIKKGEDRTEDWVKI